MPLEKLLTRIVAIFVIDLYQIVIATAADKNDVSIPTVAKTVMVARGVIRYAIRVGSVKLLATTNGVVSVK